MFLHMNMFVSGICFITVATVSKSCFLSVLLLKTRLALVLNLVSAQLQPSVERS